MDVVLKVLEGAKAGTKIAVKKDEFLIGRSQKCHLCAGSSSISRKHCAIARTDATVFIRDLGSRNGTLVNGEKIADDVELTSGDEVGIGTLKMLVTITPGITNLKRPEVKTVAEAVERTAAAGDSDIAEEDITQWLHDAPGNSTSSQAVTETQTIRMDDTKAVELKKAADQQDAEGQDAEVLDAEGQDAEGSSVVSDESTLISEPASSAIDAGETDSGEKGKKPKKQKPGKLPPIPTQNSKDSREAAMQALRNWNRRR